MKHILLLSMLLMLGCQALTAHAGPMQDDIAAVQNKYYITLADGSAVAILHKAADKSRGKLKKKLPSLKLTGYDIRRDYWELVAHGDFNPFDFQISNLKNYYIKRQAGRFGYTRSTDLESIMKRLEEGDQETLDFVSSLLTIVKKKK